MKKKLKLSNILLFVGIALVLFSLLIFLSALLYGQYASERSAKICAKLSEAMPEPYDMVPDGRLDTVMPAMEVDGDSFCGIIELPAYGVRLPIRQMWSKFKALGYPCRYSGSIYDGTLVIGGSDGDGQFDFMKDIDVGQKVIITDMTGGRYSLAVNGIKRLKGISANAMSSMDADLVLFARNSFSLDYTVVLCSFSYQ